MTKSATSHLMWFMLGGFSTVLIGMALPNGAQHGPARNMPGVRVGLPNSAAEKAKWAGVDNIPTMEPTAATASSRRPFGYYGVGVRPALFSAPQPPGGPKSEPVRSTPTVQASAPPLPVIDPFADWAYTGTVKIGEQVMALMENTKTKEGQYVKVGESFLGAQVSSITDQMITLTSMGKPNQIAKSSNITVTPLDKNAGAAGGGQPNQPAPGGGEQPNQQAAGLQANQLAVDMQANIAAQVQQSLTNYQPVLNAAPPMVDMVETDGVIEMVE